MFSRCVILQDNTQSEFLRSWLFWQPRASIFEKVRKQSDICNVLWVDYCCWTLHYLFIIVPVMPGLFSAKEEKKWVGQNVFYTRSHVRLSRAPRLRKKIFGLWFSTHNTTFQQHNGYKKSFSTNKKLMQPCVCYLANIHST